MGDRKHTVLRVGMVWQWELKLWTVKKAIFPCGETEAQQYMVPAALAGGRSKVEL